MRGIHKTGNGRRLDQLLADENLSRSQAARLIREGQARVNGKVVIKPSYIALIGENVEILYPEPQNSRLEAENIPISILYEDEALAVVCKPAGLVVHPAAGNPSGTLVNALLFRLTSLSGIGGEKRPGIVHRLDKDTSGLMLVAKNDRAHAALSAALANRSITKHYLACVEGQLSGIRGEMDGPIARSRKDRKKMAVLPEGRPALTRWKLVRQDPGSALVLIHLITGRTHQIRVHFSQAHHPVLGDVIYGGSKSNKPPRLLLHAWSLTFEHPLMGELMRFTAPPDEIFHAPDEAALMSLMDDASF
jgi:23S rRNA pseudouridine1911/1915/1917 synthase